MSVKTSIHWFKSTFGEIISEAVDGTPWDENLLVAIAYQETGYIWQKYIDSLPVPEILTICVGDTLDAPNRFAFPKNDGELKIAARGNDMFKIARKALLHVAKYEAGYRGVAQRPHKFCRGYGIFQYDLQFFKVDPEYFLQKKWEDFESCLAKCLEELGAAMKRQGWASKSTLTRNEKVHLAIAYNKGTSQVSKGFKQGHKSGGKYYGENIDAYMAIAESLRVTPVVSADSDNPQPNPVASELYRVQVNSYLILRQRATKFSAELARLPPGQIVVRLLDDTNDDDDFWRIETNLNGTVFRGYVASQYLKPIASIPEFLSGEPVPMDLEKVPAFIRAELDFPARPPKYGDKSRVVRQVQEWLCLHRIDTAIDNDFGPSTRSMLKRLQETRGLNVSGHVTKDTWEALVAPMKQALAKPNGIEGMKLPEAILAVAKQHVSLENRPFEVGGENAGPWVRLYCDGRDGKDWLWCAGFVSFMLKQAAFYRGETPLIAGSVSCDTLASQAMTENRFVTRASVISGAFNPETFGGCAIFLQRKSPGDWNHTGLAFNFSGTGDGISFNTIEGNTNAGGSRNGGEARQGSKSMSLRHFDFISLA